MIRYAIYKTLVAGICVMSLMLPMVSAQAQTSEPTREELLQVLVSLLVRLQELQAQLGVIVANPTLTSGDDQPRNIGDIVQPTTPAGLQTRVVRQTPSSDGEADIKDFTLRGRGGTFQEGDQLETLATISFEVDDANVELLRLDVAFEPETPDIEDDPWHTFRSIGVRYRGDILSQVRTDNDDIWDRDSGLDNDSEDEFRVRLFGINVLLERGRHTIQIVADIVDPLDDGGQEWSVFIPERGALFVSPLGVTLAEGAPGARAHVTGEER